jgi:hypothetical protein
MVNDPFTEDEVAAALKSKGRIPPGESQKPAAGREKLIHAKSNFL